MLHGDLPKELERFLKSGAVDWFPRLCAFLLWTTTAQRGPAKRSSSSSVSSPFATYSRLLPDPEADLGLLLSFDEREAELLLPRELAAVAAREREGLRRAVHDRWLGEKTSSSSEFSLSALGLTPRGFESTLAAAALVNSRCFAEIAPVAAGGGETKSRPFSEKRQALSLVVPLCDFANHASAPSAAFRLSSEEEGCFELVATRGMRAGEEVTISYLGGAGNAASFSGGGGGGVLQSSSSSSSKNSTGMLRAYGFVTPGNPADRLASLAGAGAVLEARAGSSSSSSPSPPSPSPLASSSSAPLLLSAASASLASRSRDAAERRRIAAAAASIAEGMTGGGNGGNGAAAASASTFSSLGSLASRVEAEAEEATAAAGRAASLALGGDVSPARAEAASAWWVERAELARCGAELLRELAAGG